MTRNSCKDACTKTRSCPIRAQAVPEKTHVPHCHLVCGSAHTAHACTQRQSQHHCQHQDKGNSLTITQYTGMRGENTTWSILGFQDEPLLRETFQLQFWLRNDRSNSQYEEHARYARSAHQTWQGAVPLLPCSHHATLQPTVLPRLRQQTISSSSSLIFTSTSFGSPVIDQSYRPSHTKQTCLAFQETHRSHHHHPASLLLVQHPTKN